jgi:hypothetical protein
MKDYVYKVIVPTIIISIILMAWLIPMSGAVSNNLDVQGDGYFWTSNDIGNNHDRAGGTGSWMYGNVANSFDMMSLYQFKGAGGFYRTNKLGNVSQNIQASDLSKFNASVSMQNDTVSVKMNGTGRLKMVLLGGNNKNQPVDLSRTYMSGTWEIENKGAW